VNKGKWLLVFGLTLALSRTAGALTNIPFRQAWPATGDPDGAAPIYCHLVDHSCRTVYVPEYLAGGAAPEGVWLDPDDLVSLPAPGATPGEDAWGVFEVDQIRKADFSTLGDIVPLGGDDVLYLPGDEGVELVGIHHGYHDIAVKFNPPGPGGAGFETQSIGGQYEFYLQDSGLFDDGVMGSSGRNLVTGDYATTGTDAGATLVLDGSSQTGFYPDMGLGDPESFALFYPSSTYPGRSNAYVELSDPGAGAGTDNARFSTGYFVGWFTPNPADFRLEVMTAANNGFNLTGQDWLDELSDRWDNSPGLQGAFPAKQDFIDLFETYDWTVNGSDPMTGGVGQITEALPGDANGDGAVTDADYTIWADNYGVSPATAGMGDFNADESVTDADYTIWADHYGETAGSVIPEPVTVSLLSLNGLALLRRRRPRSMSSRAGRGAGRGRRV
jgi:hypothetical protein